jgi:hypothetical protein
MPASTIELCLNILRLIAGSGVAFPAWQADPSYGQTHTYKCLGRDKHNRTLCRRVAKKHNHSIKIKAKVRPRGTRNGQWYTEGRVQLLRKKVRTQCLWNLHLVGDWHHSVEDKPLGSRPHMMRCMLTSNIRCMERILHHPTAAKQSPDSWAQY